MDSHNKILDPIERLGELNKALEDAHEGIKKIQTLLEEAYEALGEVASVAEWCALKHFVGHPSADSIKQTLFEKGNAVRASMRNIALALGHTNADGELEKTSRP